VRSKIEHPFWMILFLVLTSEPSASSAHHRHLGGRLREVQATIRFCSSTPLTFPAEVSTPSTCCPLSGGVSLFNPWYYLVSGFRWSFYGLADVSMG